jgi:two-component system alkaline phosphatase synthesis response regulator PhoP
MNNSAKRGILVIEDDPDIATLVRIHLGDLGHEVEIATDGNRGLERALAEPWSLVILDLMLPGIDGFEVCKRIRAKSAALPILMLTARAEELDKVLGLELGADDYLTKPFSVRELTARVKAILRRIKVEREMKSEELSQEVEFGGLRVDFEKRRIELDGKLVELTAKELDLLLLFARHPGRAYSRQELLDLVWGYQFLGYSHTVNTHINRLRGKIEVDPSAPKFIKTVWGLGYRFTESQELAS